MKSFKKLGLLLVTMFLIFSLTACGDKTDTNKDNPTTQSESNNTNNSENNSKTDEKIIDREGKEITLPEKTDKIISLAPSITETLVNLGLVDKLVAVDKYSIKVEGVNPELPIFDIMNPDAENIVTLGADIILGTGMTKGNGADPFAPMIEAGTFVTVIPTSTSIQGILDDITFIGKVTGKEEEANKIVKNYSDEVLAIVNKIKDAKKDEEITVYFETSPAPSAYTFGKNTFLNDMLEQLNVKNIFGDQEGWLPVSDEQVLDKNPSVILTNSDFMENATTEIKERAGWNVIEAVKNDRVYLISGDSSSRANENSIVAFKEMAKALYPDLFNE